MVGFHFTGTTSVASYAGVFHSHTDSLMTCIPKGTKKISGSWDCKSGAKVKDESWTLIERYIREEAAIMERDSRGYIVAEANAERGWILTYAESNDEKLGPPTLELFHDLLAYWDARAKQYTDSISIWQRRYLQHQANSPADVEWPGAESNLFKITVTSCDFKKHWETVRLEQDPRFQQFMDCEVKKSHYTSQEVGQSE